MEGVGIYRLPAGLHQNDNHTGKCLVQRESSQNRQHGDDIGGELTP